MDNYRGELVIVRAYGNEPLLRRIWEVDSRAVYICSEETYQALLASDTQRNPVGFGRNDTFVYNATAWREYERGKLNTETIWPRLKIWRKDLLDAPSGATGKVTDAQH